MFEDYVDLLSTEIAKAYGDDPGETYTCFTGSCDPDGTKQDFDREVKEDYEPMALRTMEALHELYERGYDLNELAKSYSKFK